MIKSKLLIISFLWVLLLIPFLYVSAASNTCRTGRDGYCAELAAVVPGLEFLQYDESKGLGGFIASLYVFGLGLVGFSALIVLIYSSFLYMTAGDNMNRVNEARKRISGAIFGLVIAFLSWIILRTINPDLVQSLDIKLTPITLKAPPTRDSKSPLVQPGSKKLGGECSPMRKDCATGLYCPAYGAGAYTCRPEWEQFITTQQRKKLGEVCYSARQDECAADLYCPATGPKQGTCQPVRQGQEQVIRGKKQGEPCNPTRQAECAAGLKCAIVGDNKNTCQP